VVEIIRMCPRESCGHQKATIAATYTTDGETAQTDALDVGKPLVFLANRFREVL
jgi:hypothetical protein